MIGRTNTGGGGGGLAFRVLGGTSAPSSPKPNDIWVNTSEKITSYIFSATEPENPVEGIVWFFTGTFSAVAFNALKKNNITVCPTGAKQFIGGAFVGVVAETYLNGAWKPWGRLPGEYQEVEYIQTTGAQYIDTGIVPSDNTYQVSTKIVLTTTEQNIVVLGTNDSTHYQLTPFSGKWYVGKNGKETGYGSYSATVGQEYVIDFNDSSNGVVVNNETLCTGQTFMSTASIKMARRGDGTASNGKYKYFYFKLLNNKTGELLMDLVPCYRRSDSVAGMYDLVSKKFFANNGTGTFIVGGDVY
jgi:hypothetical protein